MEHPAYHLKTTTRTYDKSYDSTKSPVATTSISLDLDSITSTVLCCIFSVSD